MQRNLPEEDIRGFVSFVEAIRIEICKERKIGLQTNLPVIEHGVKLVSRLTKTDPLVALLPRSKRHLYSGSVLFP